MGGSIASQLIKNHYTVITSTADRSPSTKARVRELCIVDLPSRVDVFNASDIVVSVCSGGGYYSLAREAHQQKFTGIYIDANSMPPEHAAEISLLLSSTCQYVDAAIYGYPIPEPKGFTTERTIYAHGSGATALAELLENTAFVVVQTDIPGKLAKNERLQR